MADTKIPRRLLILQRLQAALQQITPANGYTNDLSNGVYVGKSSFGAETPRPFITILENINPAEGLAVGYHHEVQRNEFPLIIQGFADDNEDHPSDPAYYLQADVEQCLGNICLNGDSTNPSYMLGPNPDRPDKRLLVEINFGQPVVSPPRAEVSAAAFFIFPVQLVVVENRGGPYVTVTD